jgi:putative transposase
MGKKLKPEEIIAKLRDVEVRLSRFETEQTHYRWREEYGWL